MIGLFWWPIQESNQGHEDFQSSALPTELTGHIIRAGDDLLSHRATPAVP